MTDIQEAAIPAVLAAPPRDILAAAKTGSGKTLAFVVPLLEILVREKWSRQDGVGALILVPTRELALQIFSILVKVGCRHSFSAGLVIGGKSVHTEKCVISKMNILVATPGRLLQHMDQTENFETDNLRLLVLDEADKILELGFAATLDAIVANLPQDRQTILFSATQTHQVDLLARVCLQPDPLSISVHGCATPQTLSQFFTLVDQERKIDVLFSFARTHLKNKILVFVSTCKQVQFLYSVFCKLRPGIPISCLHGRQSQMKRISLFQDFCSRPAALLFATDIASRGLDFPLVDWVVQMDLADSIETHIHRVGRTARYESSGNALLFLTPKERSLGVLEKLGVPIQEVKPNDSKMQSVREKIALIVSQSPEIKAQAQKAVKTVSKAIAISQLAPYNISSAELDTLAMSMGLFRGQTLDFNAHADPQDVSDEEHVLTISKKENRSALPIVETAATAAKRKSKKASLKSGCNTHMIFDEDGLPPLQFRREDEMENLVAESRFNISNRQSELKEADVLDKQRQKDLRKEKKHKSKKKLDSDSQDLPTLAADLETEALGILRRHGMFSQLHSK